VPLSEWASMILFHSLGSEDSGAQAMTSCVLDVATVELGHLGHGHDFDIEARGKPLQELGLPDATAAAGRPR
ncbi:MAG: hypothetical protein ACRDRB_10055, partial [Pseudonocardiaceae bacterium]